MHIRLPLIAAFAVTTLSAQNQVVLGEDTVKISDHVWAIMGFPNIAIVVGDRATLVVDTGLGPRNGATIARVAAETGARESKAVPDHHPFPSRARRRRSRFPPRIPS